MFRIFTIFHVDELFLIYSGLSKHSCSAEKIQFVVCTHGHSDHVGNLNLFPGAVHIVSHDICVGDQFMLHDFKQVIFTNSRFFNSPEPRAPGELIG